MSTACVLPTGQCPSTLPSADDVTRQTPELFRMISRSQWGDVISRCESHSLEASFCDQTTGLTALHLACRNLDTPSDVIGALLVACPAAAMTLSKNYASTPLHFACWRNLSVEVVVLLISSYPSAALMPNGLGLTPLHLAARTGNKDVVQALMSVAPETACWRSRSGFTPLHLALQSAGAVRQEGSASNPKSRFSTLDFVEMIRSIVAQNPKALDVSEPSNETPLELFCTKTESRVKALMHEAKMNGNEKSFLASNAELKLIWGTFIMILMRPSIERLTPGRIMHAFAKNQDSINSITFTLLSMKLCSSGLGVPDEGGNLPLHVLCSNSFTPRQFELNGPTPTSISALDIFLAYNKGSSKVRNSAGELPLDVLLKSEGASWDEGIKSLLAANPAAAIQNDRSSNLAPFMLAATNEGRGASLGSTFELLRACPEFSRFGSPTVMPNLKRTRATVETVAKRMRI